MSKVSGKITHTTYNKTGGTTSTSNTSTTPKPYYTATNGTVTNASKHSPSPCRYWKQGTCKLGEQCRFLHEGARTTASPGNVTSNPSSNSYGGYSNLNSSLTSSGSIKAPSATRGVSVPTAGNASNAGEMSTSSTHTNSNSSHAQLNSSAGMPPLQEYGEGLTTTPPSERVGRRPFLKVVVLYASDSRVLRYAKDVQQQFLDSGVDVYLQIELENSSSSGTTSSLPSASTNSATLGGGKENEIKTENLAEIITSSTNADFLIVIGDRNMKNQSCQVKKRGKLVEMDVEQMLDAIWNEWIQHQTEFSSIDRSLSPHDAINSLTLPQSYLVLQRFPPHSNFEELMKKAKELVDEVKSFKKANTLGNLSSGGKPTKKPSIPSLTTSILTGSTQILDEKQSSKLTHAQNILVRIHKQASQLHTQIEELPESRSIETFTIDREQFGHRVGPDYKPLHSMIAQISSVLKIKLLGVLTEMHEELESFASSISSFAIPIWNTYFSQHGSGTSNADSISSVELNSSSTSITTDSSVATPDASQSPRVTYPTVNSATEWACVYCTSVNELYLKECKVCGYAKSTTNDDDGSWEAIGEKKKKKNPLPVAPSTTPPVPTPTAPSTSSGSASSKPPASTSSTTTTTSEKPGSEKIAKPKKQLLDPIPGLAAAKQAAAKASAAGNNPKEAASAAPASKSEARHGSTYSSIVSGASVNLTTSASTPGTSAAVPPLSTTSTPPPMISSFDTDPSLPSLAAYPPLGTNPSTVSQVKSILLEPSSTVLTNPTLSTSSTNVTNSSQPESSSTNSISERLNSSSLASQLSLVHSDDFSYAPSNSNAGYYPTSSQSQDGSWNDTSSMEAPRSSYPSWKPNYQDSNLSSSSSSSSSSWGNLPNGRGPSNPQMRQGQSGGLRTPTKSSSPSAPQTPTFTTPYKSYTASWSRYGITSPVRPTGINETFTQADPKPGVIHPCWYCGEESNVECSLCPRVNLETFFCSSQHQMLVWKYHVRTCHPVNPSVLSQYENGSYSNSSSSTQQPTQYGDPYGRRAPVSGNVSRYSASYS